jgi:hypothetical protein
VVWLKKIYIVFERTNGWIGKAIRWFTGGEVNHVAIMYDSEDWQEQWLVEALERGVFAHKRTNEKYYEVYELCADDAAEAVRGVGKYIGEWYDYIGILGFALVKLWWRVFKRKLKKPFTSSKGQLCSELVARVLQRYVHIQNPQWVEPNELLKICRSNPQLFRKI